MGVRHSTASIGLLISILMGGLCSCSLINPGPITPWVRTDEDENHWLVKNIRLGAGMSAANRSSFDHAIDDKIVLMFVPNNEKNRYVTKSVWHDPMGLEYRTVRQAHDLKTEIPDGSERYKHGTPRFHTMVVKDLYRHKPGPWKVELFPDDKLARRLNFEVR